MEEIDETVFETRVIERSWRQPVAVLFHAGWCDLAVGFAQPLEAALAGARAGGGGTPLLLGFRFDATPAARLRAIRHLVHASPILMGFRDGRGLAVLQGARTAEALDRDVGRFLAAL